MNTMPSRAREKGQAAIEYSVVCLILVLALFHGNPSPAQRILSAVQYAYDRLVYGISLP